MRCLPLLAAFVLAAGCLGAPSPSDPTALAPAPPAATAPGCTTPGEVFSDAQALTGGGTGKGNFTLGSGCSLGVDFVDEQQVGSLRVTIDGPNGTVLRWETTGLNLDGRPLWVGPDTSIVPGAPFPSPAGAYAYAYHGDALATFRLTVTAASP